MNRTVKDAKVALVCGVPTIEDEARGLLFQDKMSTDVMKRVVGYGVHNPSKLVACPLRYHEYRKEGEVYKYQPIRAEEFVLHREMLRRELAKNDYNIIVAFGETALRMLTPYADINRYRGSVVAGSLSDAKVIGMVEPYRLTRDPKLSPFFDWDIQKLMHHKGTKDLMYKDMEIIITEDLEVFAQEFLSEEFINNPDSRISFDIECAGNEISCIGFSKDINVAYVLPLYYMTGTKLVAAIRMMDAICRNPVHKIAQNGNFDCTFLGLNYGIKVNNFCFDTMLAQHAMFPNLPKGLDVLASIYTNEKYWKDEGKSWKNQHKFTAEDWQQFFEYNGKDAANTLEVAEAQEYLLDARGTRQIFEREMRLCYPLIHAELKGMKVDLSKQKDMQRLNDVLVAKAELFLHLLVDGDSTYTTTKQFLDMQDARRAKKALGKVYKDPRNGALNINSPKQVKEYLYGRCKYPKRVKKGKPNVDENALLSLQKFGFELISVILFLRKYKKRDTFYSIKTDRDGRVRTTFKPGGTETGRLSSSKSISGTGFNLQTIFKEARVFFVSDDDYILLAPDYAKAESWVVAYLAGDKKMLAALRGPDFHSTNASRILGKTVTKSNYIERQLGKKISHAANYRTTAFTLQVELAKEGYIFTKAECQAMLDAYFREYSQVKRYQEKIIRELSDKNKTIITPFGRKITYYEFWGTRLFNMACAYKPQSSVGDMTNEGLCNLYYNLKEGLRMDILLQVHDQIVMQIHKDDLTWEVVKAVEKEMTIPITIGLETFTIPIDMSIGTNWYELSEITNEQEFDNWMSGYNNKVVMIK